MPGRRLPAAALALALLAAVGCGDDDGEGDSASTIVVPAAPDAATVRAIDVELTGAGVEPRRSLDLDLGASQAWEGRLRFEFQASADLRLVADGPSRLDVLPRDDGRADASAILGPLSVTAENRGGPVMQPANTTFESTFTLDADRTISDTVSTVETTPESSEPPVGPVDPALPWFIFPVPDEPVGEGATWRLTGELTLFGALFQIGVDVDLVELGAHDHRLRLDVELEGPETEEGSTILRGTGVVTGDPARVGPSRAQVTAEGGAQRLHLEVAEE